MIWFLFIFLLLSIQDAWATVHVPACITASPENLYGSHVQPVKPIAVKKREKRKMHWANTGSLIATAAFGVAVIGIADKPVLAAAAGIFLVTAFVLGIVGVMNSGRKKDKSGRGWGLAGIILGALVILFELAELILD